MAISNRVSSRRRRARRAAAALRRDRSRRRGRRVLRPRRPRRVARLSPERQGDPGCVRPCNRRATVGRLGGADGRPIRVIESARDGGLQPSTVDRSTGEDPDGYTQRQRRVARRPSVRQWQPDRRGRRVRGRVFVRLALRGGGGDQPRGVDRGRSRRLLRDGVECRPLGAWPRSRLRARHGPGAPAQRRRCADHPQIDLDATGVVPGIDEDHFRHREAAKKACPVSRALAGVPEIALTARLADS